MSKKTGAVVILGTLALAGVAVLAYKLLSPKPGVATQPPALLPVTASLPGWGAERVMIDGVEVPINDL